MASPCYMSLKGQKQGDIKGGVTQKGHEGKIMVTAVSHDIFSPRDPQSGLPTGKRQHKPFTITKDLDKSTPLLYNVLVSNENVQTLTLEYWHPSATGQEKMIFTVKLTNANIAAINHRVLQVKDPALAKFEPMEEIAFTYQKIEWTWADGGISGLDDWEAQT
jgi:type VI secretion system secreted protein Hcp